MIKTSFFVLFCMMPISLAHALDWTQFRGPQAASFHPQSDPPIEFSSTDNTNIAWKVEMPGRSAAGPLVVGKTVVTTSSGGMDNQRIFVTGVDLDTGAIEWQQEMVCRGRPYSHPYSSNAAPTAASDGERIFAFYSSNDLLCVDLQGNILWYRALGSDYPKINNDTGLSSSPLVIDGVVIVQIETQGDSFIAGFDSKTGETRWRVDRPRSANWASPVTLETNGDRAMLLATSGKDVVGIDPTSGKKFFELDSSPSTISSATVSGQRFYVASDGLTAYQVGSPGTQPVKLWNSRKLLPGNSSPVIIGDAIWVVKSSVLSQGSTADGEEQWKLRLPDAGSIWSSPVVCGDRLYLFSDQGKCFVVNVGGEKGELLATSQIDDTVLGSPAPTEDALIVRGDKYLWKIAKK